MHTHIILPKMNTLSANRKSNINPVIDDQRHPIPLGNTMEPTGNLNLSPRITLLVPILDNGYTCVTRGQQKAPNPIAGVGSGVAAGGITYRP
jgi:hypothetical protein